MLLQRQLRIMRLQKLFKATLLNSNLGILYKVIKTELADSGLSVTVSAAKKNFLKSLLSLQGTCAARKISNVVLLMYYYRIQTALFSLSDRRKLYGLERGRSMG